MVFSTQSVWTQHQGHGAWTVMQAETLDPLVVTAERINKYVHQYPSQVEVMGVADFQQHNILGVEEAVNGMAGVNVNKSSGTGSRISIHGSAKGGNTILVLLNGRPMNSGQYGGVELSSIPIDIVESIIAFHRYP